MTNNLIDFLGRIKKRVQIPKIYAIVFHDVSNDILDAEGNDRGLKLHMSTAYDLEEAIHDFIVKNSGLPGVWRPLLWSSMGMEELKNGLLEVKAIMTKEETEKQSLMKQILDKNDLKMLERNKKMLSEPEYKYLKERLTPKKRKPKK